MNAHEVLVKARNLIEREGWWDGTPSRGLSQGECVVTGTCEAAHGLGLARFGPEVVGAWAAFAKVVEVAIGGEAEWNDTPGRTKEEVLAAFDEAIRRTAPPPADPLPRESYEGYCERQQREWDEEAVPVP